LDTNIVYKVQSIFVTKKLNKYILIVIVIVFICSFNPAKRGHSPQDIEHVKETHPIQYFYQ